MSLQKPLQSIADAQQAGLIETLPQPQLVIGQQLSGYVEDPDVLGQIQTGLTNFVESGQLWAMIGGFILGYMFAGLRRG
ncbi:hypothetical protein Lepto7376_3966 [[Leptolyngbya] sp. PCC 7376]|uniref:hypothetical protein n=1 Tax=[Leptolyngbya] sp. PCC 7376 TaxID=111781 RepID=UPI00029F1147|nr:hypothetical protein [[Leptolyngbya] sp. PCC 7376]AFY40106.1 hypothetical protein Lepto7376_3966 [[Leptolyngbya] sp. PCC 7376]